VAEAIRVVAPFAVDVASGIESSPGVKDRRAMERFVEEVRRQDGIA
jgi:phosphoribosylanthranilate isomerase